jgi:hypothetical protein
MTPRPVQWAVPDQRSVLRDAAGLLRRLIEAVHPEELKAGSSQGRRLLRRLEGGAATAFEEASKAAPRPGSYTIGSIGR